MLFSRPIRALLPEIDRGPININKEDDYNKALKSRQEAYTKNKDTHKDFTLFSAGSTVEVQMKGGGC